MKISISFFSISVFVGLFSLFNTFSLNSFSQGGVLPLKINFSQSDKEVFGISTFDYYPFRLNTSADSSALGFVAVVCDSFPDLLSGSAFPVEFFSDIRIDSIRIKLNHVNHSGLQDTLIIVFADTYNGIFPNETGSYVDSLYFNTSLAPGDSYSSAQYITVPVGEYVSPSFSLILIYKAPQQDTLTLWSGYGFDGICTELPGLKRALHSHYYPNAFAYRKEFGQLLPTISGSDVFFECDTVPGLDTLTDGRSYIQNWDIDFFITSVTLNITEEVIEPTVCLFPNPGNGLFYFSDDVLQINVFSLNGSEVFSRFLPGNSVWLPLPPGFYSVQLKTEQKTIFQKLIITK